MDRPHFMRRHLIILCRFMKVADADLRKSNIITWRVLSFKNACISTKAFFGSSQNVGDVAYPKNSNVYSLLFGKKHPEVACVFTGLGYRVILKTTLIILATFIFDTNYTNYANLCVEI